MTRDDFVVVCKIALLLILALFIASLVNAFGCERHDPNVYLVTQKDFTVPASSIDRSTMSLLPVEDARCDQPPPSCFEPVKCELPLE